MQEKNDWNRFFIFAVAIGFLAGLAASLLPQDFFYETGWYYSQNQYENGFLLKIMLKNMHDFAYFLSIRLVLPSFLLIAGIVKKRTRLPQLCILLELAAVSFQAVLIFGATGMEGWFRYQLIALLPESLYLVAALHVYFFKKREVVTSSSAAICIAGMLLFFISGISLEILVL